MADAALGSLTASTTIAGTDLLYAVIGGNSRKITVANFLTSPTLVTPVLGVAAGTSLALGGATIGSDALAVTGTSAFSADMSFRSGATSFSLGQASTSSTFPVATFRAKTTNTVTVLDIMPNGTANFSGDIAWIDVCDTDVYASGTSVMCARMAATTTDIQIGAIKFGAPTERNLNIISPSTVKFTLNAANRLDYGVTTASVWTFTGAVTSSSIYRTPAGLTGGYYFGTGNYAILGRGTTSTGISIAINGGETVNFFDQGIEVGNMVGWGAGALSGSLDTNISRSAAGVVRFGTTSANAAGSWLATNGTLSGYLAGAEMSAPAAPAADGFRIFAQDNGGGKTQLMVIFSSGAAQQIAIQP